jgi:hypothetical protein
VTASPYSMTRTVEDRYDTPAKALTGMGLRPFLRFLVVRGSEVTWAEALAVLEDQSATVWTNVFDHHSSEDMSARALSVWARVAATAFRGRASADCDSGVTHGLEAVRELLGLLEGRSNFQH